MERVLQIKIPTGYEIDKEKSTFEKIVFKEVKIPLPKTWEEYCEKYPIPSNSYYPSLTGPVEGVHCGMNRVARAIGYGTKEDVEASLALLQLRALREVYVGDWKPCYTDDSKVYHIHFEYNHPIVYPSTFMQRTLSFPTLELANNFMENFKDLILKAKPLL